MSTLHVTFCLAVEFALKDTLEKSPLRIQDDNVSVLAYANDIVLIAEDILNINGAVKIRRYSKG